MRGAKLDFRIRFVLRCTVSFRDLYLQIIYFLKCYLFLSLIVNFFSLPICVQLDRFDARGYLHDLSQYQPNRIQHEELTFEELEFERMCDQERFADLNSEHDDDHGKYDRVDSDSD